MKTKSIFKVLVILAMLAGLAIGVTVGLAQSTSPPFTYHFDDCDSRNSQTQEPEPGPGEQGYQCQTYNGDVYENIDWVLQPSAPPQCTDIDSFHVGFDSDYLYVEWTLVGPYVSGCTSVNLVVEIDTDGSSTDGAPPDFPYGLRGDYYITTNLATESDKCGSTTWREIGVAGWDAKYDSNDDVGGADPSTGFGATGSDYDSSADGYDYGQKDDNNVYCRTVVSDYQSDTSPDDYDNQPGFQLAIKRSYFTHPALDIDKFRVRGWTSQSSTLEYNKLYWHDENSVDNLDAQDTDIDNTEWFSEPGPCQAGDIEGAGSVNYSANPVGWDITNNSTTARILDSLSDLQWPPGNGNLMGVALGGKTIWTDAVGLPESGEPHTIDSGWSGDLADRLLEPGTETLELTFEFGANTPGTTEPYAIHAQFDGTGCVALVSDAGPTVITLSSFAAKSSVGGSASPLWLGLAGMVLAAGTLFWAKRRVG